MRPSHRLDVYLVPSDPDAPPPRSVRDYLEHLEADGIIRADGAAGPNAGRWMVGGFDRIRFDEPGRPTLYANRQGGFSASCPIRQANVTHDFAKGLSEWRGGGPRTFSCSSCGRNHALEEALGRPAFAFASWALVVASAASASPTEAALRDVRENLGPIGMVLSRG